MRLGARNRQGWVLSIAGLGLLLSLAACGSQPAQEQTSAQPAGPERHNLRGTVVSVDRGARSLVVDHEEIPNFMGAMAMPYPVKDPAELDGIEPGNQVTAEVVVDDTGMWLENITPAP